MAQTMIQQQKKKKKTLEQQIPKEFKEDCKVLSIDFERLQPKIDRILDKWIDKENPKTKQPYTDKTVAKWIRFMMRQAGYSFNAITDAIKKNHSDLIQKGHKSSKKLGTSSVTTEEEQESDIIWQINPEDYNPDDWNKYDPAMQERIFRWLDKQYMKVLQTGLAEGSKTEEILAENKRLKEELGKLQKEANTKK